MPLREYQQYGARFLAYKKRALLADDMGLGKTVQAIAALRILKARRTLVVVPNSLKWNWEREIRRWWPGCPVTVLDGSSMDAERQLLGYTEGICIVNYEKIRTIKNPKLTTDTRATPKTVLSLLGQRLVLKGFEAIVIDEAHRISDRKTRQTEGVKKLAKQIPVRFALTGTPFRNRVAELWSILNYLDETRWSAFWDWAKRYCGARLNPWTGRWEIEDHAPDPAKLERHLSDVMLRRTKEDALDLPELTLNDVWLRMGPVQRRLYDQMEQQMFVKLADGQRITAPVVIAQITRLKQLTVSPEILTPLDDDDDDDDAPLPQDDLPPLDGTGDDEPEELPVKLAATLDILRGTEEKVVIFSQFARALRVLQRELEARKIGCQVVDGQVTGRDRDRAIDVWKQSPRCQALLVSVAAGGEGLNLQEAGLVVFLDKPWTPAVIEQAYSRVHRMGLDHPLTVLFLQAEGSIEEWIEAKLDYKEDLVAQVMKRARERHLATLK